MKFDVIIIGGGASGLCTAIKAKKNNNTVLVIEHTDRVARKILQTGNGRCNLTNSYCKTELFSDNPEGIYPYYTSGSHEFIEQVISAFDADDTVDFFNSLGVLTLDRNGYIYPRSEQASSINDILRSACSALGVRIITDYNIQSVSKDSEGKGFIIDGQYSCRFLVIATGGQAASTTGSDGSGYKLASSLGHNIIKPIPSLCGLRCSDSFVRALSGVRNDSRISLLDSSGKILMSVKGNLQFTSYGISGIPVFQISSVAGRLLDEGMKLRVRIDLLPEYDEKDLIIFLDKEFPKQDRLSGVLNKKLASVIEKECEKKSAQHRGESYGTQIVPVIKRFRMYPVSVNSFDEAQTTAGGVSTDEIDPASMSSLINPGLYFTGEIIDVNGICGGYNLQWAWSTAHVAASDILNRLNN